MASIVEKIKALRAEEGISQSNFSKKLGYSKGYIADIETGRTKPSRKFLEAITREYGTSIDWLFQESRILDLLDSNKHTENPDLIFIYAFTQSGIEEAEKELRNHLEGMNYLMVDAAGTKNINRLLKKILKMEGNIDSLWKALADKMLNQEIILTIKNMSLSKIPSSGGYIREIFKIMDDAWEPEKKDGKIIQRHKKPKSSLILLDFPSYLEKNMGSSFGYYAIPVYGTTPMGHKK